MAQRDWNPDWWSTEDRSSWDRVKEAMRRDWEQTKHDFSTKRGSELNQDVDDTVRQAVGKQPIPPGNEPNPPDATEPPEPVKDWDRLEPAMRYGYGAAGHYHSREWDLEIENTLRAEWSGFKSNLPWEQVREDVRHGWTARRRSSPRT